MAHRDVTGVRAELGNPPDFFAASDRRQRRQLAVFAGQGQYIRRIDQRRDDLDQRLPGLKRRRFEVHRLNHVLRHRTAPWVSSPEHPAAKKSRHPTGMNSGATTACPRDVRLKRISFTGR
ncbi:MAG: hypothetical protein ACXVH3_37490 [Solirubrobacteraceae bacterium]